jgi:hypothetical protein
VAPLDVDHRIRSDCWLLMRSEVDVAEAEADRARILRAECASVGSDIHDLVGDFGTSSPHALAMGASWDSIAARARDRFSVTTLDQCHDPSGGESRSHDVCRADRGDGMVLLEHLDLWMVGDQGVRSVSEDWSMVDSNCETENVRYVQMGLSAELCGWYAGEGWDASPSDLWLAHYVQVDQLEHTG